MLAFSGLCFSAYAAPNGVATPNTIPSNISAVTSDTQATALPDSSLPDISQPQIIAPEKIPGNAVTEPFGTSGIDIPSPPPASAFTSDATRLALQAEQAALQAQADAEADIQQKEIEHNSKSYDRASTGLLPLSPAQIRDFMQRLERVQEASIMPYAGTPKGVTRLTPVSLDPGVSPPQINLNPGFVTTVTVVDSSGEPWPILDVGIGGNFEVTPTSAGSHVVRIMPLTRVGVGNLSIMLKDLPTPVIFRLASGGPSVDLRYDARIDRSGPNAKPQIVDRSHPQAGDATLARFLDTTPPSGAKRIKVGGLDSRTKAWEVGDKVYVRTPLTLLSPAWNASMVSPDGTSVYEIGSAPVLLMSDNGAIVRAQILREEAHDNE
ncbi:MAG: DotH/IcmK family type IV secretion protein [Alphaproteobacteria bacterium]|nr:DotH/IcmK family type IV secretion protein [Alphaproteobacteria bacterium]